MNRTFLHFLSISRRLPVSLRLHWLITVLIQQVLPLSTSILMNGHRRQHLTRQHRQTPHLSTSRRQYPIKHLLLNWMSSGTCPLLSTILLRPSHILYYILSTMAVAYPSTTRIHTRLTVRLWDQLQFTVPIPVLNRTHASSHRMLACRT
jgi:hypothetical protein